MNSQDLEKYRTSKGWIDFDEVIHENGLEVFNPNMEPRGTEMRNKMWLHLDDNTVLLKTVQRETNLEGTCYAELITAELAKQAGFDTAQIDLIKYNGSLGIISSKVNKEGEQLHALREYIGDENIPDDPFPDITSVDFVFENLVEHLKSSDLSKAEKYRLLQSIMKLMAFDVVTLGTDRHPENISFIERMNNGKKEILLAPLYDNEFSLMLETREEDLEEYLGNAKLFFSFVDAQDPKIAPKNEEYIGIGSSHYINLLEALFDMDEDIQPYVKELINKLDIDRAIETVEQKLHAPIPDVFKNTARFSYRRRMQEISKEFDIELEAKEIDDLDEI